MKDTISELPPPEGGGLLAWRVKRCDVVATYELRSNVLNSPNTKRPGDDTAIHYAAYLKSLTTPIAVGSFFNQDQKE